LRDLFKNAPASKRTLLWAELIAQLHAGELDELVHAFPTLDMMSWEEVRSLCAAGVSIGSHGLLHELHHAKQPFELRRRELADSKSQIEAATGRPCKLFAFPNGTFTSSSSAEVRAAGYTYGFTMVRRAAGPREDPMLLPRLVPGSGAEKLISALVFGN